MDWWGDPHKLEFFREADAMAVLATRVWRPADFVVSGALGFACIIAFAMKAGLIVALALGVIAVTSLLARFGGLTIELRVTEQGLSSRSEGIFKTTSSQIAWKQIRGLEFRNGGEDEPSGLYARQSRWEGVCLMNGLTRKECVRVVEAIFEHFPYVETAVDDEGGILDFFRRDDAISLGLSKKDR